MAEDYGRDARQRQYEIWDADLRDNATRELRGQEAYDLQYRISREQGWGNVTASFEAGLARQRAMEEWDLWSHPKPRMTEPTMDYPKPADKAINPKKGLKVEPLASEVKNQLRGPLSVTDRDVLEAWTKAGYTKPIEDFVEEAWNTVDETTGTRGIVQSITLKDGSRGPTVEVEGIVRTADGSYVGGFTRSIYVKLKEVHHDLFTLNGSQQGTGFGSAWYQSSEVTYKEAGIKEVTIYANIDVGGYAWARMGFDFRHETYLIGAQAKLERMWSQRYNTAMPRSTLDSLQHSWEIAAFVGPDGFKLGKESMLNSSWQAIKYMADDSLSYRVGEAYYESKAKQRQNR
jgi:hypothetical protein